MKPLFRPEVLEARRRSWLGGISLAGFNALISTISAVAIFILLRKDRRA